MLVYNYDLDIVPGSAPVVIHVSQYNDDFRIVFALYSSKGSFTMPEGASAEIRGTKIDGNGYSASGVISGNNVTVYGHKQMTAIAGKNIFELTISNSSNPRIISSANFVLDVEKAPLDLNTVQSDSVLLELNSIIAGADTAVAASQKAQEAASGLVDYFPNLGVAFSDDNDDGNLRELTYSGMIDLDQNAYNERLNLMYGYMSGSVTHQSGLVLHWYFIPSIGVLNIRLRGTTTEELVTNGAYVNLAALSGLTSYINMIRVKLISYNSNYKGQIRLNTDGSIQIGYSVRISDGVSANVASGTSIYIDETFMLNARTDERIARQGGSVSMAAGTTLYWYFVPVTGALNIRVRGTLTANLATNGGYVTVADLSEVGFTATANRIKIASYNASYKGQVRINPEGTVQLGYTTRTTDNVGANVPSGQGLYIDEVFFIY